MARQLAEEATDVLYHIQTQANLIRLGAEFRIGRKLIGSEAMHGLAPTYSYPLRLVGFGNAHRSSNDTHHKDVKMDFKPPMSQLKDLLQMICRLACKLAQESSKVSVGQ